MKFKYILIHTAILILAIANSTYAACTFKTKVTAQIAFSNVVVQRDAPVGTVLTSWTHAASRSAMATCNSTFTLYNQMVFRGGVSTNLSQVYATNIPGVGIKSSGYGAGYEYMNPPTSTVFNISSSYTTSDNMSTPFQLIKTGPITSGVLSAEVAAIQYLDSSTNVISQYSTNNAKITALACSVQTQALNFSIGDISTSSFGGTIGSIPGNSSKTQNLGLNCDAGANINVSLQGTQNPDVSTTSVLALTGQGSADVASGVGVELVYNGSPLILNNRIVLKQSAGGQETFPITARYYQTKTTVGTGKANASATLDLTYQ
ncbi:fimbrial protein [Enterobacteriaceae bacterium C34A]